MLTTDKPEPLKFYGNWRRVLLLGKISSFDLDEPVDYVLLNTSKLPCKLTKFCEQKWSDFEFDYDPYSYLLWPLNDKVAAQDLSNRLNDQYPGCAKVVLKSPAEAHDLDFSFESRWNNLLE